MRALALALLVALPAHADLYRWIDPDSGSVKISSSPPSDPRISAEVVPSRARAREPQPAAPGSVAALETRWRELVAQLTGAKPEDFNRAGAGLRQHFDAYQAVKEELDRIDPAGAARRQRESVGLAERMKQGLAAQFSPPPPTRK